VACADCELSLLGNMDSKQARQHSSSIRILEDEIYALRKLMEQSYLQVETFNSEVMIDISRKLDIKINEYMQLRPVISCKKT